MGNEMLKFKSDKFRKSRGGHSRWLLISCAKCKAELFPYQKDGPGILKRLYLDRIVGQARISCDKCKTVIGIKTMYKKENRPVIRLFVGAIEKKVISENKAKKFVRAKQ
jgi:ribosomal protein S27E